MYSSQANEARYLRTSSQVYEGPDFNLDKLKPVSTPMSMTTSLDLDEKGEAVDQREYMSMIGSLLYLMMTQPDIQFTVCLCVHFQSSPCSSHRTAVQ
jgi:hypothetical protein